MSNLRLLILTPTQQSLSNRTIQILTPFPDFLGHLTGTKPAQDVNSFSGYTTHPPLHLKTRYYETNVSIWCDEIPEINDLPGAGQQTSTVAGVEKLTHDYKNGGEEHHDFQGDRDEESESDLEAKSMTVSNLAEWQTQMTSEAAREVREVIGGIVLLLPYNSRILELSKSSRADQPAHAEYQGWVSTIEATSVLRDMIEDETGRDVASIVVLQESTLAVGTSTKTSELDNVETSTDANLEEKNSKTRLTKQLPDDTANVLLEKLEDECLSTHGILGWDFVMVNNKDGHRAERENSPQEPSAMNEDADSSSEVLNEYGEKTGLARIIEVLSAVNWVASEESSSLSDDFDEDVKDVDQHGIHEKSISFLEDNILFQHSPTSHGGEGMDSKSVRSPLLGHLSKNGMGESKDEQKVGESDIKSTAGSWLQNQDKDEVENIHKDDDNDFMILTQRLLGQLSNTKTTNGEQDIRGGNDDKDEDVWATLDHREHDQPLNQRRGGIIPFESNSKSNNIREPTPQASKTQAKPGQDNSTPVKGEPEDGDNKGEQRKEKEQEEEEEGGGNDTEIQNFQHILNHAQLIRDTGATIDDPEEKRKFARREVEKLMRFL